MAEPPRVSETVNAAVVLPVRDKVMVPALAPVSLTSASLTDNDTVPSLSTTVTVALALTKA